MDKPRPTSLEFLLQLDVINELLPNVCKEPWQTLYHNSDDPQSHLAIWCALLDETTAVSALSHDSWDLMIGDGKPGFSQNWPDGKEITTYHRYGCSGGIKPLVLYRSFHGAFPRYAELDEEFRLYHDLAEDKDRGLLLSFDASGREIEVVRVTPTEVEARVKHLRQFQAGTRLHLAVYLESVRYSRIPLADVPTDEQERDAVDSIVRWQRSVAVCDWKDEFETFSLFHGKVIIEPPPREKACVWPFESDDNQREVGFIISVDEEGNDVEHSSNPDDLDNYFGANPGAPHYLTPVYFRREVLAKYFAEPERFTVSDGRLTCLSLWSCQIDNDLETHIVVFLGDLGRYLPYEERLYWRGFNVLPEGGVSETNFRRSFLAQFTNAQASDLAFRREYTQTGRDWERVYGWPLFLAPSQDDEYLLNTIRIPVTNAQSELDEQIGHLTKLLVDSLNEKELSARAGVVEKGTKGIGKLAGFLVTTDFTEPQTVIQFMRDLQTLRSTGSAHRKGSAYEKIIAKLGVDATRKPDAIRRLLEEATALLRTLRLHYCGNQGVEG